MNSNLFLKCRTKYRFIAHVMLTMLLGAVFAACNSKSNINYYSPHLFLEPTEDFLLNAAYYADFVNYPNDRLKFALKGDVNTVEYTTLHKMLWVFYKNGKLAANNLIIDGSWNKEINNWIYQYANDSAGGFDIPDLGELTGITKSSEYLSMNRSLGKSSDLLNSYAYNEAGLPLTCSYFAFNKLNYIKRFNYNEKGICTSMSVEENAPTKEKNVMDCNVSSDAYGTVTHLFLKKTRIPVQGLAIGDRDITPVYDKRGKLLAVKALSIPRNMESSMIDSVRSMSSYEYNEQGDVALWTYNDTIYPQQVTNNFSIKFKYIYDKHGNWVEKSIQGEAPVLNHLMNQYYRGTYTIETLNAPEQDEEQSQIRISRTITYFSDLPAESPAQSAPPVQSKKQQQPKKPQPELSNQIEFTSDDLAAWKIEKIVNGGQKNGGYEFQISGIFLKDCTGYSIGSRSKTIGVKEKNKAELTSVGSYVFPKGKSGEKFSFEIVGAYDGMCNINAFEYLVIMNR